MGPRYCSLLSHYWWFIKTPTSHIKRLRWKSAAAAKSLHSCPTLCDPTDGSPSGSPVPGILQARTLEWVAISFSNAWKRKVKVKALSRVWLFETPWTAAHQAPPSMGFSRQECWSGVPLPSPAESLLSLISKTNWLTCGLYWWLQTTSQAFLPQLPGFSLLTLLPMLFKYVLLLVHHRHSHHPPQKKNTQEEG